MLMGSSYLTERVEEHLSSKKYEALVTDILNPHHLQYIQHEGMDLITKLCENGLRFCEDKEEVEACRKALYHIVTNYKAKEGLICLLEQGEAFVYSDKFTYLLEPLQWVIWNLPKKREKTYSWVLSTLKSHIKYHYQIPEDVKYLSKEGQGQYPKTYKILSTYEEYVKFYTPFVQDLGTIMESGENVQDSEMLASLNKQRVYLRDYLVDLLGMPLIHFNLDWKENEDENKTDERILAEKIMNLIRIVDYSPLDYLQWIEDRMKGINDSKDNKKNKVRDQYSMDMYEEEEEEEEEVIVHMSSLVCYLYLVLVELLPIQRLRGVYSPTYMFNMILYPVTTVLKNPKKVQALWKGIRLASTILDHCDTSPCPSGDFAYSHRLHHSLLTKKVHTLFIERLCYLAVYCEDKRIRDEAYLLFLKYLSTFEPQGKLDVIRFIFKSLPSDSLVGHVITLLKEFIHIASLENHQSFEKGMDNCFLGPTARRLVMNVCNLKQGVTTDLCQNSNQILAALNLLRFLLLRDKVQNKFGVLAMFENIERNMLNPLRKGLEISKAHYELKLKELNDPHLKKDREREEKRMFEKMECCDVEIGGLQIKPDNVSISDQKKSIVSAMNIFDHMNALLAWIYEARAQCTNVSSVSSTY